MGGLGTLCWQMPGSRRGDFTPKLKNPKRRSSASCPHGKGWHPLQSAHQPGQIPGDLVWWQRGHPLAQTLRKRKENQGTQKSIQRERRRAEKTGRAAGPGGALKSPLPSRTPWEAPVPPAHPTARWGGHPGALHVHLRGVGLGQAAPPVPPLGVNASPLPPAPLPGEEQLFQDCAELRRAGFHTSGVYTLHIANLSEPKKVSAARGGGSCILGHPPSQGLSPSAPRCRFFVTWRRTAGAGRSSSSAPTAASASRGAGGSTSRSVRGGGRDGTPPCPLPVPTLPVAPPGFWGRGGRALAGQRSRAPADEPGALRPARGAAGLGGQPGLCPLREVPAGQREAALQVGERRRAVPGPPSPQDWHGSLRVPGGCPGSPGGCRVPGGVSLGFSDFLPGDVAVLPAPSSPWFSKSPSRF